MIFVLRSSSWEKVRATMGSPKPSVATKWPPIDLTLCLSSLHWWLPHTIIAPPWKYENMSAGLRHRYWYTWAFLTRWQFSSLLVWFLCCFSFWFMHSMFLLKYWFLFVYSVFLIDPFSTIFILHVLLWICFPYLKPKLYKVRNVPVALLHLHIVNLDHYLCYSSAAPGMCLKVPLSSYGSNQTAMSLFKLTLSLDLSCYRQPAIGSFIFQKMTKFHSPWLNFGLHWPPYILAVDHTLCGIITRSHAKPTVSMKNHICHVLMNLVWTMR